MQIASMQVGANAAAQRDKAQRQSEIEGTRMGLDAAKHREQIQVQRESNRLNSRAMQQNNKSKKKDDK